jgi:hypothetical protein
MPDRSMNTNNLKKYAPQARRDFMAAVSVAGWISKCASTKTCLDSVDAASALSTLETIAA